MLKKLVVTGAEAGAPGAEAEVGSDTLVLYKDSCCRYFILVSEGRVPVMLEFSRMRLTRKGKEVAQLVGMVPPTCVFWMDRAVRWIQEDQELGRVPEMPGPVILRVVGGREGSMGVREGSMRVRVQMGRVGFMSAERGAGGQGFTRAGRVS